MKRTRLRSFVRHERKLGNLPKYEVDMSGWASFGVTVEADNEEEALDKSYEYTPSICAQCSGWGQPWYLEISDDWESDEGPRLIEGTGEPVYHDD